MYLQIPTKASLKMKAGTECNDTVLGGEAVLGYMLLADLATVGVEDQNSSQTQSRDAR